jgi:lipopolysaccharide export system permease protein
MPAAGTFAFSQRAKMLLACLRLSRIPRFGSGHDAPPPAYRSPARKRAWVELAGLVVAFAVVRVASTVSAVALGGPGWRVKILDRYLVSELAGPFVFGLSAFTLIFIATQIISIGKLVSEEHAPLVAAIEYFFWDMPQFLLFVIPMAMLLGTLLAMQRLSGDSEITAMKAGGVSIMRIVLPLAIVGLAVSVVSLFLQEVVVPLANDRAAYIKAAVIQHLNPIEGNLTVVTPLPSGGKQITIASGLDAQTQSLIGVTVVQQDRSGKPGTIIYADRARYDPPTWSFIDATTHTFNPDGSVTTGTEPRLSIDIGEKPNEIAKHTISGDPEQKSRAEIKDALGTGQLTPQQVKTYTASYSAKLARPFAALVFTLIAVPFGVRPGRGGGRGLGFGLALVIIFVYYVISTLFLTIGGTATWLAGIAAWTPNAIFTLIGLSLLREASRV